MKDFKNRLDNIEKKIILSQSIVIDEEQFDKLLCVISDSDLPLLCNSSGDVLARNTRDMISKYRFEIADYQMSPLEKAEKKYFRQAIKLLTEEQQNEVKNRTAEGSKIISNLVDLWEQKGTSIKML
jgi:hypothetical protein